MKIPWKIIEIDSPWIATRERGGRDAVAMFRLDVDPSAVAIQSAT